MPTNIQGEEVIIPPKDEEEILLEKLVFGDAAGFENNLKKLDNLYDYSSDEDEEVDENLNDQEGGSENASDIEDLQDEDLFFIDDGNNEEHHDVDDMEIDEEQDEEEDLDQDSDNAWEDSDDEKINISLLTSDKLKKLRKTPQDSVISGKSYIVRLRSQFEKIYPRPQWIEDIEDNSDEEKELSDVDIDNEDEEGRLGSTTALLNILSSTEKFINTKQLKLISANKISITRLKDANYKRIGKSGIQTIDFHPNYPILLTGGFDKTIRIYQIDGKSNNFITSYFLKNCPIMQASFYPQLSSKSGDDAKNSNLIYASGRRRYMNKINLSTGEIEKISRLYGHEQTQKSFEYFKISPRGTYIGLTGNNGWCNLLNAQTGHWIHGFKIEGTIVDFAFANDESFIMIINSAGEVWEFALEGKITSKTPNKIIRKWYDDGGVGITKLQIGGKNNRWVAIGNNNGIVNIYDRLGFIPETAHPKPIKTVENLITSISSLVFNPDGQLLCIASRAKRDALRLVHLPSGSVYSNWPTSGTPLGKVTSIAFSPNNEMLAIGNQSGKVTLWRLNHY
ncbi:U3 small nucleolar RNA-associated protein, putative [Candida dubliniensis CD36]|uniref:U3 small nucleolar RNA-associated protein, putative n=1 Tax=Candida dubliniensis (strain CD36 / ATCC MYA-646 / CBS 7987 / NCPF 3949 / NRRL Y-17841) TaxID=573826 RepID=B9WJX9_CANDC|nr:U3 small nucleolar RNA-associated protein, putative [Candida dubliniensis CD36]CAX40936.1 U3 small nucleolar RNA-associated protein, putative [Candida dubliniensis CD36]